MKTVSLALVCGLTVSGWINAGAQVQAPPRVPGVTTASVAERSKALSKLFAEIWEDNLKHSPEYASYLGDKRYNDQLTDYSVQAVNASLERGRGFIERLSEIDTTGLTEQEQLSAKLMLRDLIDAQEGARFKEWQMPVNQFGGFHTEMPRLVDNLTFETVKDYDDYIARLKKIPTAFSQIMTNMQLGMDEGRMPPQYLLEKALVQAQTLADQKPAESPFARPLKKFPATISAADQKRITNDMLDAIGTEVLPAYQRFAKFLKVSYVPAGTKRAGRVVAAGRRCLLCVPGSSEHDAEQVGRGDSPDRAG